MAMIKYKLPGYNLARALVRLSVLNYNKMTIFDTVVCYPERIAITHAITHTNEEFSIISLADIHP